MNPIRQMVKAMLTAVAPRNKLLVRGPRSGEGTRKIALTFDDGPHPELTVRLLDRLKELEFVATFFVIGRQAERFPNLIRRIVDEGHEVANHTYSHSEPSQTSAKRFFEEIRQTDEILASISGRVPSLVRPPKGDLNWSKLRGLWREKKTVALWNVDPKDFRMKSADEMNHWSATYEPEDGDIVLFHDIHPYALTAIDSLAARGKLQSVETVTVSQLLEPANNRTHQAAVVRSAGSLTS